jgi:hypothetical protein
MREALHGERADGSGFFIRGLPGLKIGNYLADQGSADWRAFGLGYDPLQEVFNLSYHMERDTDRVMAWPIRFRRDWWRRLMRQFEFEKREAERRG